MTFGEEIFLGEGMRNSKDIGDMEVSQQFFVIEKRKYSTSRRYSRRSRKGWSIVKTDVIKKRTEGPRVNFGIH